ncbi:MAG: phosphodiester glycosidase family protein, partial [Ruminococcus sp.]|nr:phosphodiester glycosidase family protein [Ruminococcus sp.]
SSIAADNDAILAINGDYYGARERGYVIRNGIVYRDTPSSDDLLCIFANGTMKVVSQSDYTADELVEQGVWQAFAFGPGLIEDGTITVSEDEEVGRAMASNPRTAVGIISENHYLFVVSDGRTDDSEGLSLYELAQFMQSLGAETAYNLDGGGSSTMYYGGEIVNNPTTNGSIKERGVSDIVYIG